MDKKGEIKRIIILFTLIAIIFLIQLVTAAIWDGSGTAGDPYNITNCTQLQNMSTSLGSYFKLINDINCSNTSSWNAGAGFNPVSTFTGNFDGQNYTIISLFIYRGETNNIGLFGVSNGGNITNLGLTDVNITGSSYVGGLIGLAYYYSLIDNAYVQGLVSGTSFVGGLAGINKMSTINNSNSSANVVASGDQVGGLVGRSYGHYRYYNYQYYGGNAIIDNSYATGDVTGDNNVGGLVGHNYGYYDGGTSYTGGTASIDNSYATGNVSGTNKVGGLVGYNSGNDNYNANIDNSYATGNVTGNNNVGGLAGYNKGYNYGYASIDNTFASGSVTASGYDIGGLVGFDDGYYTNIDNSYWYNDTSDNATNCIGNPAGPCAGKAATISYFFDVSNPPLSLWGYPPWDNSCDDQGYPSLLWEGISSVSDCRGYTAPAADTTAPTWNPLPSNQAVNYSQPFGYDINADDNVAVDSYSINDTTNFAINTSGYISNKTVLSLGKYGLTITVNDTSGNENSSSIIVTVKLTNTTSVIANTSSNIDLSPADSNITLYLANNVTTTITVSSETPSSNGTTASLNSLKGIDIEVNNETRGNLTWALIKIYYDDAELTAANIDESTLKIYYYNTTASDWQLEPNQGVDTANNYVWANITHFSLFGAFGSSPSTGEGSISRGGSSGGGICEPTWVCTEWEPCINGEQTRICTDKWNCGRDGKPSETQSCSVEVKEKTLEEETKEAKKIAEKREELILREIEEERKSTLSAIILATVLTMLIASLILGGFYYFKRKKVFAK